MPRRVNPEQARDLMEKEGYVYLDVRSVPEFDAGHPSGAFNVPLNHLGPQGPSPNPDFLAAVEKAFPKDAKLILGCKAGGRSARAAQMLEAAGFTNVADQYAGYEGSGEPGWRPRNLPVSQQAPSERTWEGLRKKLRGPE